MTHKAEVIYNAACPVCRHEIHAYRRYAEGRDLPVAFTDLNSGDLTALGLTSDAAARRLHVLRDGELLNGMAAFIALWQEMPRYRWLARIVGLPGIRQVASLVYDFVLAPLLYRAHLRRLAKGG